MRGNSLERRPQSPEEIARQLRDELARMKQEIVARNTPAEGGRHNLASSRGVTSSVNPAERVAASHPLADLLNESPTVQTQKVTVSPITSFTSTDDLFEAGNEPLRVTDKDGNQLLSVKNGEARRSVETHVRGSEERREIAINDKPATYSRVSGGESEVILLRYETGRGGEIVDNGYNIRVGGGGRFGYFRHGKTGHNFEQVSFADGSTPPMRNYRRQEEVNEIVFAEAGAGGMSYELADGSTVHLPPGASHQRSRAVWNDPDSIIKDVQISGGRFLGPLARLVFRFMNPSG